MATKRLNRSRRRRRQARLANASSDRPHGLSSRPGRGSYGIRVATASSRLRSSVDRWLHLQAPGEPPWKHLPTILAVAFAIRAALALAGDFVLHPDEIMQYLEPAHRLAFGNGVIYWEYFYGARSWLLPGAIASVLKLFELAGAGQPAWYVAGVKLGFCLVSLVIPASMYFIARRHFGELSARAALVAGALWYELAGFAHKPMTEFVATAVLLALLALVVSQEPNDARTVWQSAFLGVLASAIRLQYAPLALALMAVLFIRTKRRTQLVVAATLFILAVGVFDAVAWDGGLFHSYMTNIRFNLVLGEMRAGESQIYQYLEWLLLASAGLSAAAVAIAVFRPWRYGFLLALAVLLVAMHSLQAHKEYRFVFAVIPIWLLIAADIWARFADRSASRLPRLAAAVCAIVSIGGLSLALPGQGSIYKAWSGERGAMAFAGSADPIFAAYRYLAGIPGVKGVWQVDRPYFDLPGYYYLHHDVPLYDQGTGRAIGTSPETIRAAVSHIVTGDTSTAVPGYSLEREFGRIRILRRDENSGGVWRWEARTPTIVGDLVERIIERIDSNPPSPPENSGIRFVGLDEPHAVPRGRKAGVERLEQR